MRILSIFLSVLALAAVAGVFFLESTQSSPGPLHPVHEQVAELGECASCHAKTGGMSAACLVCHTNIAERRAADLGIHADRRECSVCHDEHFGDQAALLSPASFARAGIEDLDDFDHSGLDLGLEGRHWDLECVECHRRASVDLLDPGESRYLGLDPACASCHDDPHEGAYGNQCAECHVQDAPFTEARGRAHDRFPLTGAHAEVACGKCHEEGTARSVAASLQIAPDVRNCQNCHESPHDPTGSSVFLLDANDCVRCHETDAFEQPFGVEEHRAIGVDLSGAHAELPCVECHAPDRPRVDDLENCVPCHGEPHAPDATESSLTYAASPATGAGCENCHSRVRFSPATVTAADHEQFGSTLAGAHLELSCESCHERNLPAYPSLITECQACHESPHRPEFEGEDSCVDCHSEIGFDRVQLTPERHRASGFSLAPPHDDVECMECHAGLGTLSFAERFPGRDSETCEACHDDPHGELTTRGTFAGAACLECHETTHFVPAVFQLESHTRTGWPLSGSHAAVPCASCHEDRLAFTSAGTECVACHESTHSFPSEDCEQCHGTNTFRETIIPFDHDRLTAFPLVGAHAKVECQECHGSSVGRSTSEPIPSSCAGCHGDPHAGQFREYGDDQCVRCHSPNDFSLTTFDHQTQSRFVLDGEHLDVPCASCHREQRTRTGKLVVRYRPIPHECGDCHEAGGE